ncbi:MAG: hypothetical protein GWP17_00080 [Aquificales bacterium]|nr:hypothetical protein [Aquificales bacterium]
MLVAFVGAQTSAPPISHTLLGRSNCLVCHAEGFQGAAKNPDDHAEYTNEDCQDCHELGVIVIPTTGDANLASGTIPSPIAHPPSDGQNSCYDCHVLLDQKHADISVAWEESVHGQVGIGCADCHGGDPRTDEMNLSMLPEAGFLGVPTRAMVPNICGGCHSDVDRMRQYNLPTDQYVKYIDSVHGKKLQDEGDTKVALCTDCHGIHDIKKASDPTAAVYPLNVPELCAKCHADPTLMEPYGIPTNQFEVYKTSVHGKALLDNQDVRAPNCASCHGSHAAKPPTDSEVVNVCGKCHTATQGYYEESLHSRIGDNAPKCWTCHGTHDVFKPDESMFLHPAPIEEQHCGTCHLDNQAFRMDKSRFAAREDRRCDTCHHEGSMIMVQVQALRTALVGAADLFDEAEAAILAAKAQGMLVSEAEADLAEAHTSLIRARAVLHTTKLPAVNELTDDAKLSASSALEIATNRLNENLFRRRAMIIAIGAIGLNVVVLYNFKRQLYRQLDDEDEE